MSLPRLLELNSISVLTRLGWNRDTLNAGDEVTVFGNRDKDYGKPFFFANYFVLPDGREIASANLAPESIPRPRAAQEIVRESHDTILFRYESMDVERRVHLGMTEHPPDTERTHLGHSIAWFEGDTLVVDTAYFAYNRWGNGRGIPSGDQKHAVERYTLIDGGRRLRIESVQEDPEYLAEPVLRTSEVMLTTNYEWEDFNCDPVAAGRHLDP